MTTEIIVLITLAKTVNALLTLFAAASDRISFLVKVANPSATPIIPLLTVPVNPENTSLNAVPIDPAIVETAVPMLLRPILT